MARIVESKRTYIEELATNPRVNLMVLSERIDIVFHEDESEVSLAEKIAEKLSYLINMDKNMSEMLRCNDTIVSHLSDISNYTSNLVEIREFMYAVKLGIDTLNTKGITLKR